MEKERKNHAEHYPKGSLVYDPSTRNPARNKQNLGLIVHKVSGQEIPVADNESGRKMKSGGTASSQSKQGYLSSQPI